MSKLLINFDLMEEIQVANHGISLNKAAKIISLYMGMNSLVSLSILKHIDLPLVIWSSSIAYFSVNVPASALFKPLARERVSKVVNQLNGINIHTNLDSMLKAKTYKREYNFKVNETKIPDILQHKYIMVPTSSEKEISLLQEHIIGTHEYYLSAGQPEKVFKLAYSQI